MFKFLRKTLMTILFTAFASQASAMWIQADWLDPTAPGVGTNRYAYSANDPINKFDPNGNSWLDRAWDSVAGEGSFNRTFGDSGSAWSDRNFGNSFEKSYSSYYSDVRSYESTLNYDPATHGFPSQSYPDSKQGYIENSSLASGRAVASNIDIDVALTVTGIGPAYRGARAGYFAIQGARTTATGEVAAGALQTTVHGAERLAGAAATRGGVVSAERATEVISKGRTLAQSNGATVSYMENAGRFDVVVHGQRGVITTFENLSQKSFDRLARNYGWH